GSLKKQTLSLLSDDKVLTRELESKPDSFEIQAKRQNHTARQDLCEALNNEIAELDLRLSTLKDRQIECIQRVHGFLTHLRASGLVKTLPTELLVHIFALCLPE